MAGVEEADNFPRIPAEHPAWATFIAAEREGPGLPGA
jgi:hypothetical protein